MNIQTIGNSENELLNHKGFESPEIEKQICCDLQSKMNQLPSYSVEDIEYCFKLILNAYILPSSKIRLCRELMKRGNTHNMHFDMHIGNRIRKWILRWRRHDAAAAFLYERAPFSHGLTIRFLRNYRHKECMHLAKSFFRHYVRENELLKNRSGIIGVGTLEPDIIPVAKSDSLHAHTAIQLSSVSALSDLALSMKWQKKILRRSADAVADSKGKRAIYFRETKLQRLSWDLGWITYITKKAEHDENWLSQFSFTISKSGAQFMDDRN